MLEVNNTTKVHRTRFDRCVNGTGYIWKVVMDVRLFPLFVAQSVYYV